MLTDEEEIKLYADLECVVSLLDPNLDAATFRIGKSNIQDIVDWFRVVVKYDKFSLGAYKRECASLKKALKDQNK